MYPQPPRAQPPQARPRVRWVADAPTGAVRPRALPRSVPYAGPPAYRTPPRWGFPNLTWRFPTAVPGTASDTPNPMQRLRLLGRNAVTTLWVVTGFAAVTGFAELWRYILLVISRDSALTPGVVGASDALVIAGSLFTFVLALMALGATIWWLLTARSVAAAVAGEDPPRSTAQVLAAILVPGVNLFLAGAVLAELEHAVLRRPRARRPKPSRLARYWWAAWVVNGVLLVLTVIWRARDGVQAQADGVLLTAVTDLAAAALAALTALLVARLTKLIAPISPEQLRPMRVVKVTGAPAPERPARPATAAR